MTTESKYALIEYRIRKVERYIVTRFTKTVDEADNGRSSQIGEYSDPKIAYEVANALAKHDHEEQGWPLYDSRIKYPEEPSEIHKLHSRGILHVTVGDDNWQPTEEEMTQIADLMKTADSDPQGAVVVTRPGIRMSFIPSAGNVTSKPIPIVQLVLPESQNNSSDEDEPHFTSRDIPYLLDEHEKFLIEPLEPSIMKKIYAECPGDPICWVLSYEGLKILAEFVEDNKFDPVTKMTIVKHGLIGRFMGIPITTDVFEHPRQRFLKDDENYLLYKKNTLE